MKYDKTTVTEVLLQKRIELEKKALMDNIEIYRKYLYQLSVNYNKDDYARINKLYGTIIGLLFKNFYGCNSTELKKILRNPNGIKICDNEIMYVMNSTHLKYYLSMLKSMNNYIDKHPTTDIDSLESKAGFISTQALNHFYQENETTKGIMPFNNLVETAKQAQVKKEVQYEQTVIKGFERKKSKKGKNNG